MYMKLFIYYFILFLFIYILMNKSTNNFCIFKVERYLNFIFSFIHPIKYIIYYMFDIFIYIKEKYIYFFFNKSKKKKKKKKK